MILLAEGVPLPIEAATQTFLVVGKRGSGKSNSAVRFAEQLYHAGVPWIAIDPVDNWHGVKSSRDGKGPGLSVYVFGGPHGDLPLEATAGALIADTLVDHRITAVLSVKHFSVRERGRFVGDFAQRLFQRNREPLHLFLEEAHEVAPQNPYKGEEEMLGHVARIWKLGRSTGLGGSAITQRPASLSKNITTQAEILIVHRTLGPQDVAAIREWIKYHGEREEILGQLATLKTGEAFVWAPDFPEGRPIGLKRVMVHRRETFDSAATPKAGERRVEPKALAAVDLNKLQQRMAATIEKAKADDPRELRKRIAALEAELKKRVPAAAPAPVKERRVEVPVLKDAQLARLEKAQGHFFEIANRVDQVLGKFGELKAQAQAVAAEIAGALRSRATPPAPVAVPRPAPRLAPPVPVAPRRQRPGDAAFPKAERAILTAAAQRYPAHSSRAQLSILSGYSINSSSFANALGALRAKGWLSGSADDNSATQAGREAIGPVEAPPTGAELATWWQSKLPKAEGALLGVLVAAGGSPVTRQELSERSGYSESSSSFANALGKLRTLELATGYGNAIRANEDLI